MIDIDKLICSLIEQNLEGKPKRLLTQILDAINAQGIIYKDGSLQRLANSCESRKDIGIDIPFGAKDSELIESTITIPEGFTAEIKGNQVMLNRKIVDEIGKPEVNVDKMVEEYWNSDDRILSSHTRGLVEEAYRQGILDTLEQLKKGE